MGATISGDIDRFLGVHRLGAVLAEHRLDVGPRERQAIVSEAQPPLILAVNDEPTLLALYDELLTEEGYRVVTEVLPVLSVTDVAAIAPDLIVLDLLMGRLEWGTTFLSMLRAAPGTSGLPVVVCTAASEIVEELVPQLDAWGVTVVTKPFDIDDFLGAVRAKLDPGAGAPS